MLERSEQPGQEARGRALLIVVPDGNAHLPAERVQDSEALRLRDVLEVDPAEGRLEELDRADDLVRILGGKADRHRIHPAQILEEHGLAFHHGQPRLRADVAEAQAPACRR